MAGHRRATELEIIALNFYIHGCAGRVTDINAALAGCVMEGLTRGTEEGSYGGGYISHAQLGNFVSVAADANTFSARSSLALYVPDEWRLPGEDVVVRLTGDARLEELYDLKLRSSRQAERASRGRQLPASNAAAAAR